MPRRALRPAFVVTFAVGAAAIASGCSKDSGSDGFGDASINDGGCPAQLPASGGPCVLSLEGACYYGSEAATCQGGTWVVSPSANNPPPPAYEAGPDVDDAAPDVHDGGADGEGQDGGRD